MRLFVLSGQPRGDRIEIGGRDFHYLAHVRRLRPGDSFLATDGRGARWRCVVRELGRQSLQLSLEGEKEAEDGGGKPEASLITVLQALPKGRKMDMIVRQATEAGVGALLPVLSLHSLAGRADGQAQAAGAREERWQRVAREAVQQSGRSVAPFIGKAAALGQVLAALPAPAAGEVRLLAHQERVAEHTLHEALAGEVGSVVLAIGPEGGFAAQEVELLRQRGFLPITFGATVLRTETAALYAVAAVQIVLQEKQVWRINR